MLLAIDVGNTNSVFAVFDGETLKAKWRFSTDANRTADEFAALLLPLYEEVGLAFEDVTSVCVASVVPQTVFALKTFSKEYLKQKPKIIGEAKLDLDIQIKIDRPQDLGADRLLNAIAAKAHYDGAMIIVDFGTATTFDVINDKGDYVGGVIAPGINLSLDALQTAAAKLPEVAIVKPVKVTGTSTVTAMQSGIYWGYIGLIEGIVAKLQSEHPGNVRVIATGGLAPLFAQGTDVIETVDEDLTLKGVLLVK